MTHTKVMSERTWTPRPDRRWGWVSHDGYEIEWRKAEAGESAGYYLFGPDIFGVYVEGYTKAGVQRQADWLIWLSKNRRGGLRPKERYL